jgi:hypothetical protein
MIAGEALSAAGTDQGESFDGKGVKANQVSEADDLSYSVTSYCSQYCPECLDVAMHIGDYGKSHQPRLEKSLGSVA